MMNRDSRRRFQAIEETPSRDLFNIPSTSKAPLPETRICPTYCFVCGDTATACHYEVPACHGCRSFFRRTIMGQKNYECKRDGNCYQLLPTTKRCSCKGCRLKKCIQVGMNPLAIQCDDSELEKNDLIKRIVMKRESSSASPVEKHITTLHIPTIDQQMTKLVDGLLYLELKKDKLRKSAYNPDLKELPPLKEILKASNSLVIGDKAGPMPNWPLKESPPPPPSPPSEGPSEPAGPPPHDPLRKRWFPYDLLCCIEYVKTFPFFHTLAETDQLVLIKSVAVLTFTLTQAYFSYENKSDMILHPDGSGFTPPKDPHDKNYRQFVTIKKQSIMPLIRSQLTKKEYVLLKAILLCNAGLGDLSDYASKLLTNQRERHSAVLLRICLAEGGVNGPARYAAILSIVDTIERISEQTKGFHLLMKINFPHVKGITFLDELLL